MKVKVLIRFKDLDVNRVRKVGEVFEATKERCGELISHPFGILVEEVKETKKHG